MPNFTKEQKQWLEALRSGEYQQCVGRLWDKYSGQVQFCCLGVACDLFFPDHDHMLPHIRNEDISSREVAPDEIVELLHLQSDNGAINDGHFKCLTQINDGGATFEEIADFIEQNPELVFTNFSEAS